VDAKARGASLSFQSSGQSCVAALQTVALTDSQAVAAFANDFRKVCPPQEPGQVRLAVAFPCSTSDRINGCMYACMWRQSGGYSESELQEIADMMAGQVEEIQQLRQEWLGQVDALKEQQAQALKCQATRYSSASYMHAPSHIHAA